MILQGSPIIRPAGFPGVKSIAFEIDQLGFGLHLDHIALPAAWRIYDEVAGSDQP
jgi:hypothetical protein